MKNPVNKEYFIISLFFLTLSNKPRIIIPTQRIMIDRIVNNLRKRPKNKIEISVATRGPDPLAIGYTFVKSPI